MSIANRHSQQKQTFVYCDLYAGQGEFEDGSAGSPMIALDIMEKLSENLTMLRLELYFAEKDKKRAEKLSGKLASRKNHRNVTNITVYGKCWQDNVVSLRKHLNLTQWGFLFIDPFANQIDLGLLKALISENYRKDVIVFLNLQAVRRQAGSMKARKRVAEFLNINASDLEAGVPPAELIDLIRNSFRIERKQYQMLATIPNTRKGRLTNSDYFALLCATNSVGVADSFLKSYAESVEMFKDDNNLDGLFGGISLETKIIELIDKDGEISLKDAFSGITKAFFSSWKKIDLTELPSTDNLIKAINTLSEKSKIVIEAPEGLLHKRSSYKRLKKAAKNNNETMGHVRLRKKS